MEKRYISEGRYKKSSSRKRRDVKKIRKKVLTDVANKKKLETKKQADSKKIALDALERVYEIQNNSKLINAIKTYRVLR